MEALTLVGSATPRVSSSLSASYPSPNTLSYAPSWNLSARAAANNNNYHHLSSFKPVSRLFSYSPSRPHTHRKNHVFLPHLVASLEEVQQTYIMIKPDGVQRGLVGEIISRFERKGFKLTALKLFQCPNELAEEHYKDLQSKPFFPKLIKYITSGPVVCMAWEGIGVVASARKLIGATNPLNAEPGTIRGDLSVQTGRNVVHGSDSPENGKREIALWFKEGELCEWTPTQEPWLIE
ncbi:PREDICTED: nucleoside diphosphate kinase 2, chloroplastic [Ipomoea nil]|uniref:nucleoside diphosphate kinase 2, chloroplastic n=1 Tax=Ipomoea nil TaxID=35883 RepID=UPI000901666E|nr:PREDICTED: nucleoside diphosphate kinase 2, chloroplastic [Ipomoea nil]